MEWWIWPLLVVIGLAVLGWRYPQQMDRIGANMQQAGCALTLLLTVPIVGLVVFGIPGLVIGGLIGLVFGAGLLTRKPEETQ